MLNLTVLEQLWELGKNDGGYLASVINDCEIDARIDRSVLVDTIWIRCGNMEPIANDTERFRRLSQNWFKRKNYWIKELLDTLEYEYNPIHNYDRLEEGERHNKGTTNATESSHTDAKRTDNLTNGNTQTVNLNTTGSGSGTQSVSPWDYDGKNVYVPTDSQSSTTSGSNTGTVKSEGTNGGYQDNVSNGNGSHDENRADDETYKNHMSGNIGVTTTQQMIESQRQIIDIDVYEMIAQRYVEDNFYMVY